MDASRMLQRGFKANQDIARGSRRFLMGFSGMVERFLGLFKKIKGTSDGFYGVS